MHLRTWRKPPTTGADGTPRRLPPRGQSMLELALITPVLLLLLLGAIDLGRVWYSEITIANSAREGVMEASFDPTSFQAGQNCDKVSNRVMCRAINEAANSFVTVKKADVTMTCSPSCTPGTPASPHTVTVRVQGHFSLITPLMGTFTGGQNITLAHTASATIAMTPTVGAASTPTPSPSPTPTPTPTPTPPPGPTPTPAPTASPTPTPAPCVKPVANFTVAPASGKKKQTVFVFTDTSTNMSNASCNLIWSWNFGDGAGASSNKNPSYTYQSQGTYTASLVVSNTAGTSLPKNVVINVTP